MAVVIAIMIYGAREQGPVWLPATCEVRMGGNGDTYVDARFQLSGTDYTMMISRHGAIMLDLDGGLTLDSEGRIQSMNLKWDQVMPRAVPRLFGAKNHPTLLASESLKSEGLFIDFSKMPHCLNQERTKMRRRL